jgi:hypothetical protein
LKRPEHKLGGILSQPAKQSLPACPPKMKLTLSTLLGLVALASAVVVPSSGRRSYEGYKVYRLSVGQEVDKVADIIERLGLTTWKGAPRAGAVSDIVVPPSQIEAFLAEISGMEVVTMHEDLGLSIEDEASFRVYEGASQHPPLSGLITNHLLLSGLGRQFLVHLVPQLQ